METAESQITLGDLPTGARIVVKCKNEWRGAVVSKNDAEKITLLVYSATGGTYRLRRVPKTILLFEGDVPILPNGCEEDWRENFMKYDSRW